MYICDGHAHTRYSFDGCETPETMCEAALARNLDEIALTDHYDIDCMMEGLYEPYRAAEARGDIMRAAEKYAGKLRVTYGIELGQPYLRPEAARDFLAAYEFSYVIGSVHNLENMPDFSMLKYELMTERQIDLLFERNLDALHALADFRGISTMAHITYMQRYVRLAGRDFTPMKFEDRLRSLFRKLMERGIALEMNTSTMHRVAMPMPDFDVLRLYRLCGGELITVGSDAHTRPAVGMSVRDAYHILSEMGFRYVTTFQERKPVQHSIR